MPGRRAGGALPRRRTQQPGRGRLLRRAARRRGRVGAGDRRRGRQGRRGGGASPRWCGRPCRRPCCAATGPAPRWQLVDEALRRRSTDRPVLLRPARPHAPGAGRRVRSWSCCPPGTRRRSSCAAAGVAGGGRGLGHAAGHQPGTRVRRGPLPPRAGRRAAALHGRRDGAARRRPVARRDRAARDAARIGGDPAGRAGRARRARGARAERRGAARRSRPAGRRSRSSARSNRLLPVSTDMQERIARNEATFRRINEDIGRGRDAGDDSTLVGFVCECGKADCARLIEMTAFEYEHIRGDARPLRRRAGPRDPRTSRPSSSATTATPSCASSRAPPRSPRRRTPAHERAADPRGLHGPHGAPRRGRGGRADRRAGPGDLPGARRRAQPARSTSSPVRVVLDLRELEFIDSSGLRTLLTARRRADEAGAEFSLVAGHRGLERTLEIAGVHKVFTWTAPEELRGELGDRWVTSCAACGCGCAPPGARRRSGSASGSRPARWP